MPRHLRLPGMPGSEAFKADRASTKLKDFLTSDVLGETRRYTRKDRAPREPPARGSLLSWGWVRNHLSNIFAKLAVADRAQAIVRAPKAGPGGS